jgi:hypothetical protein
VTTALLDARALLAGERELGVLLRLLALREAASPEGAQRRLDVAAARTGEGAPLPARLSIDRWRDARAPATDDRFPHAVSLAPRDGRPPNDGFSADLELERICTVRVAHVRQGNRAHAGGPGGSD